MKIFKESGSTCHQSNGNKDNSTHVTQTKMKLKRTRKKRTCHECKKTILKNESYGQRSVTLGSKQDGESESFDGNYLVVHQMRIKVDICQGCAA